MRFGTVPLDTIVPRAYLSLSFALSELTTICKIVKLSQTARHVIQENTVAQQASQLPRMTVSQAFTVRVELRCPRLRMTR
jgi:hypothetical protein